jgi:hypothetical protein
MILRLSMMTMRRRRLRLSRAFRLNHDMNHNVLVLNRAGDGT